MWQKIRAKSRPKLVRIGRFFENIYIFFLYRIARFHRNHKLDHVFFVAVTGSAGKTTTKDYAIAVLSRLATTSGNTWTYNSPLGASLALVRADPSAQYFVSELGIAEVGDVKRTGRLIRPRVTAVTNVGYDHYRQFRSLEAIAEEKRFLVEILPDDGFAVLNADDAHVRAMAEYCRAPILWFGRSAEADLRAFDIAGAWPERFAMTVAYRDQRCRINTNLIGRHWESPLLAAIGIGVGCGASLQDCAHAVAGVEPEFNRLSNHETPDGVTFLLDAYKAPFWSIDLAFNVIDEAAAKRKIIVLGTISDLHGDTKSKYRRAVRTALKVADKVFLTGPVGKTVRRGLPNADDSRLHHFKTVYDASQAVNRILRTGDLVLLKGSAASDHLERIYLDRLGQVTCWREHCGKKKHCPICPRWGRTHLPRDVRQQKHTFVPNLDYVKATPRNQPEH